MTQRCGIAACHRRLPHEHGITNLIRELRREFGRKAKRFRLSPAERDPKLAKRWLERLDQAGLDGVVAKRLESPYLPGSREGVVKVKPHRTADCVIVGFRWSDKADGRISTLLLGLYADDGSLDCRLRVLTVEKSEKPLPR